MSWNLQNRYPVITSRETLPYNWGAQCVSELQVLNSHPRQPLRHGDIIKADAGTFAQALQNAVDFANEDVKLAKLPRLLYAAYSSLLTDPKSGEIDPSWFSFGNGQSGKKLLLDVSQLIDALQPEELTPALTGKGQPVATKSLRWHPAEFRPAAYRSHDPGTKLKGDAMLDLPACNVLAFIGLTFYPTIGTSKGTKTLGFSYLDRAWWYHWPVWESPLSIDELQTCLHCTPDYLRQERGFAQTWKSRRFSSEKSLYFAPAQLAS